MRLPKTTKSLAGDGQGFAEMATIPSLHTTITGTLYDHNPSKDTISTRYKPPRAF
jgi:hypothetical protein